MRPLPANFGSIASDISPVSPDTQTCLLGKSTVRMWPSSHTERVARSRWVNSSRPCPIGCTSQGWSSPVTCRRTCSVGTARAVACWEWPPAGSAASAVAGPSTARTSDAVRAAESERMPDTVRRAAARARGPRPRSADLVLPALPVVPREGHQDRAQDRPDDAARAQREPVAGQQADDEASDEGADEPGDDRRRPVDAVATSAEQELGRGAHEHPEQDDAEDEHAATLGPGRGPQPVSAVT